jgi:hypothetical protein
MEPNIRTALSAPFADDLVKRRRGSFGKEISYVEGNAIIARLNDVFDNNWNFTIVEHHVLETGEVLVLGRIGAFGVVKEAFGRGMPAISKETGEVFSQADAYKSAATDALKKAATLLGVALNLYADDPIEQPEEKSATQPQRSKPTSVSSRASSKQVSAIWSLGRRLGLDANKIRTRCAAEHGAFPEQLDRTAASAFIGALADEVDANKGAA